MLSLHSSNSLTKLTLGLIPLKYHELHSSKTSNQEENGCGKIENENPVLKTLPNAPSHLPLQTRAHVILRNARLLFFNAVRSRNQLQIF
jgi:hypothetical protein